MSNDEDFTCYLQYNCLKDYLAFTTPDVKEAVKTTILSRHKKPFAIWQKIMNDWHLKNYFNMHLPIELLGGGILPETIRDRVVFNLQQESTYQTPEILLLYAQYPKTTVPARVYDRDTDKELTIFNQALVEAGYSEPIRQEIYQRKQKELLFEAKMESIGVKKEQAKQIIKKAETINLVEQYAMLSEQLAKAKNAKERRHAKRQLKAFIKLNSEHLFEHKEIVKEIHKILNQPPKIAPKQQNQTSTTEDSLKSQQPNEPETTSPKSVTATPQTPVATETTAEEKSIKEAPSKKDIFPNVYDYLNERIDRVVETELKIKDKKITFNKKQHITQTKLKTSAAKTDMTAKSVLNPQTENSDQFAPKSLPLQSSGLASPRLADNIHIPPDIFTWTDDYLENIRNNQDRRIADIMRESSERLNSACSKALNSKSLAKLLEQSFSDDCDDIYFPGLSRRQQSQLS